MLNEKRHFPRSYFLICAFVALSGCAEAPIKENFMFWPEPPQDPRVMYVRSYSGASDFRKGSFLEKFIFGEPPATGLSKPYGVFARDGKIYVTTTYGAVNVTVIDTVAKKVSTIGDTGRVKLGFPIGVAMASDGRLYVADAKAKSIFVFDAKGDFVTQFGKNDGMVSPAGLAIDDELGRLYVADSRGHKIVVFSLKGEKLLSFGTRGTAPGEFNFPTNVSAGKNGVYVVDTQNFRVQVFDKDGKFISKFGSVGDSPGTFSRPKGIGLDSEGHVYVVDTAFSNIQIFDKENQVLLDFGQGAGSGAFQSPAGLYVDEHDRIYATDQLTGRVLVFQYFSDKWKKENPEDAKKYIKSLTAPVSVNEPKTEAPATDNIKRPSDVETLPDPEKPR